MRMKLLAGGAIVALLAGCASDPYYYNDPAYASRGYYGAGYNGDRTYYRDRYADNRYIGDWRVTSIEVVQGGGDRGTGAGAVIGGIAGGVIGHQIGSGRGNDAATVAGAIGGAIVGNEIEKNRRAGDLYRVTVRNSNGYAETYVMESVGSLRVGDRVRVDGGRIYPVG
jgi:outer membrane lipoprotein SlyB